MPETRAERRAKHNYSFFRNTEWAQSWLPLGERLFLLLGLLFLHASALRWLRWKGFTFGF